ncbi:MAG: serine/threonine-protein kinase [Nannocystaceae bacterium]
MKRCPECGTEYPDGAGYCPQDGILLVEGAAGEAGREGWRMIMPKLVRRPREGEADDDGDRDDEGAGDEGGASDGVSTPTIGSGADAKTPGTRRRAGRQMSLGAFAQVPREADGKKTLLAYGAGPRPGGHGKLLEVKPSTVLPAGEVSAGLKAPEGPALSEEALVGRVLDQRYRIDAKIGAGGMGIVYRATHVIIDKPLALKVLRSEHAAQHQVVQRFLQEAQLASRIKHPNVVDISDYGQLGVGAAAYYVMEHLSGRTLAQAICAEGRLAPARAVDIAIQVARGLGAAHDRGIVHRDLKPDNVFLTTGPEGQELAKILDFGIARGLYKTTRLTAQGVLVGTPAYMAPEQAQSSDVDARADLYSLGIILFEALTGKAPFGDRGPMETINQHLFEAPPGLRAACPELPELPTIERVIRLLLAKDRSERPGDAAKVIELLEGARKADLSDAELGAPAAERRRVDTAAIGSGSVGDSLSAPISGSETLVDSGAATRPRASFDAVEAAIKASEEPDVIRSRRVSPSGRIKKRPSVIVRRGTPVERFVPPPVRAKPERDRDRDSDAGISDGELRRPEKKRSGPPLALVIGVAAVCAMAVTVTLWKYVIRQPTKTRQVAPAPTAAADEYVRLRFESSPAGADVLHSGERLIGKTPIDFQVPRGDAGVLFIFRLPGHVDVVRTVIPDRTKSVRAELNPAPISELGELAEPAGADADATTGGIESATTGGAAAPARAGDAATTDAADKPRPKKRAKKPLGDGAAAGDGGNDTAASAGSDAPPPEKPKSASDLGELKNPFAK